MGLATKCELKGHAEGATAVLIVFGDHTFNKSVAMYMVFFKSIIVQTALKNANMHYHDCSKKDIPGL